jgi:CheY-like chemotaxis protein
MNAPFIALVENDDDIRQTMAELLSCEGYEVMAFENGKTAVEGLRWEEKPSLILLDWMMPVMNGEQFLRARASLGPDLVPVVVVSAVAKQAASHPRLNAAVEKPLDIDQLFLLTYFVKLNSQIALDRSRPTEEQTTEFPVNDSCSNTAALSSLGVMRPGFRLEKTNLLALSSNARCNSLAGPRAPRRLRNFPEALISSRSRLKTVIERFVAVFPSWLIRSLKPSPT